jgi:hypothetical protein
MPYRDRITATGLPERDFQAIKAFLVRSTVPLIYESDAAAGVQGSGSLFDYEGCLYFVTAGHVLERVDPHKLGVPFRAFGSEVFTLGTGLVGWSRTETFDVAAYRIDDLKTIAALRESYSILGKANVAPPEPDADHFVVVGYPASTVVRRGKEMKPGDLTQIHTTRYVGEVVGPCGEHDLFLKLDRQAQGLWGHETTIPALPGISGGPVWQVRRSTTSIWTPESALGLVGIQVSTDPRGERYMRALRWEVVAEALRKLAPQSAGNRGETL